MKRLWIGTIQNTKYQVRSLGDVLVYHRLGMDTKGWYKMLRIKPEDIPSNHMKRIKMFIGIILEMEAKRLKEQAIEAEKKKNQFDFLPGPEDENNGNRNLQK